MLHWSIEVLDGGKRAAEFEIPGNINRLAVIDMLRLLTAKGLSFREIVECIWNKPRGRRHLLDVQHQDEGRTLTCGHGSVSVYARQMWKPSSPR